MVRMKELVGHGLHRDSWQIWQFKALAKHARRIHSLERGLIHLVASPSFCHWQLVVVTLLCLKSSGGGSKPPLPRKGPWLSGLGAGALGCNSRTPLSQSRPPKVPRHVPCPPFGALESSHSFKWRARSYSSKWTRQGAHSYWKCVSQAWLFHSSAYIINL